MKKFAYIITAVWLTVAFAQTYKAGERAQKRRDRAIIARLDRQGVADLEHFKRLQNELVACQVRH